MHGRATASGSAALTSAALQALIASEELRQNVEAEQREMWLFNSILLRKEVRCLKHAQLLPLHAPCLMHASP